ncbi:unnamed protein product [Eruca vesicaria subsp. sativa]|uniref:Glycine-rich protein n=1 Tax=Eruca vesicaria subsp. sativa TaxID=29727 RepID=A0ABC8J6X2_ERUVS|nr:unnamed protein product [Eruca vesicaria subsp. sativa]
MQGDDGDPFNSGGSFGGFGGSFGGSFGGPNNGPSCQISNFSGRDFNDGFAGSHDGPPIQMSSVLRGDFVDGFGVSFGDYDNVPPVLMSNVLGDSVDGFGGPNNYPPSLMSNFFGGGDPFDNSFFAQPFSGDMFHSSLFGHPTMGPLPEMHTPPSGFIENQLHQPQQPRLSSGPIIEEITDLEDEEKGKGYQETKVILGKHGRSSSEVETEETIAEERRITHMHNMNANAMVNNEQWQPQTQARRITHMENMNANVMVNNEQWQPQTHERRVTNMPNMNANAMVDNEQWQPQTQERRIINMHNMNAMVNNGQWKPQTQERRITPHMQNMNANAMVNYGQWPPQTQERMIRHMHNMHANAIVNSEQWQPQTQGYIFQSSTVTYGGHDGNYYYSSTTRRTGSDGLTLEESKEANTATREAAHRISRGFNNKGHTVERTLNSDGRVDTNQILHNLNEDELAGFDQSWSGNAGMQMQLPCLSGSFGSGLVNREQPLMLLPPNDPSPSRGRGGPYRRRNEMDLSRRGF